ncbi:MAG TPA: arginase family protein [Solirubrobacteraceae bacterium]|nr:arginase family protein [Solirubrobacteraceae bacterium]
MERLVVIGAPTSAGAYAPGQEDGPAALRSQGLPAALEEAGLAVEDAGDIEHFRWRPDPASPRAANAAVVADRAVQVAARVTAALAEGGRALVLGGDCTVGVGTMAALAPQGAGLVYLDRHGDLNTPGTTIDGALDWMGVAHMLGLEGADAAIAELAGTAPMLTPERLAYLALDREIVNEAERERLDALRPAVIGMRETRADPAGAAAAALAALRDAPALAVHFDVDVLDFLDAPLAENVDRTPGLPLGAAAEALAVLLADPRVRAVTVTEFNPHHGADDGSTTRRLVAALAAALAPA